MFPCYNDELRNKINYKIDASLDKVNHSSVNVHVYKLHLRTLKEPYCLNNIHYKYVVYDPKQRQRAWVIKIDNSPILYNYTINKLNKLNYESMSDL